MNEWKALVKEALSIGIKPEEILKFIKEKSNERTN
ncbi:DNA-binding anti-repressor SinI [Rossellomorea aquimaris]|jgi:DNA-binding transcriptional regulator YhcF (GntR family)|nr:DNA-binding anti-repressor SinI [Rossellomorea aquimaris]TYS91939.1 DNA-binding anti-repressor SinI [Rossellomorea aquimaris]